MWKAIAILAVVSFVVCVVSALLLRLQPIGAEPGWVNRVAGITIGNGFRLTRHFRLAGDQQLAAATLTAWLIWVLIGGVVIALISPGYQPQRYAMLYGALCGLVGAVIGLLLGLAGGSVYAKATNMSGFEGKAGYFVVLIGLLGGFVGFILTAVGTTLFFQRQGQ